MMLPWQWPPLPDSPRSIYMLDLASCSAPESLGILRDILLWKELTTTCSGNRHAPDT